MFKDLSAEELAELHKVMSRGWSASLRLGGSPELVFDLSGALDSVTEEIFNRIFCV